MNDTRQKILSVQRFIVRDVFNDFFLAMGEDGYNHEFPIADVSENDFKKIKRDAEFDLILSYRRNKSNTKSKASTLVFKK